MNKGKETLPKFYKTTKTARYNTYGTPSEKTKYFWFALHGSKMTCEQMIYKFSEFDPKEHFVVAPEALHRFYANGFGGDVVASWMTSRDRLHEIADFTEYLSGLHKMHIDLLPPSCKKIILGFSQGGTTMYRWLNAAKASPDYIIPYSCWIPEDIDLKKSKTDLLLSKSVYTYGVNDQFLSEETIKKVMDVVSKNNLDLDIEKYEGDHRIDRNQVQKIFEKYILFE